MFCHTLFALALPTSLSAARAADVYIDASDLRASADRSGDIAIAIEGVDIFQQGDLDLDDLMDGGAVILEDIAVPSLAPADLSDDGGWIDLTVKDSDGMPQTREHILLARQTSVPDSTGYAVFAATAVRLSTSGRAVVMDIELSAILIAEADERGDTVLWESAELAEFTVKAENSTNIGSATGGGGGAGKVKFDRLSIKKYSDTSSTMETGDLTIYTGTNVIGVESDEID